jgi:hypothetical protein
LELHPTKTKIVYCKDGRRKEKYPNVKFDFLGYGFRPRWVKNSRSNELFCGFTPAVSATALKAMRTTIRDLKLRSRTDVSLAAGLDRILRTIYAIGPPSLPSLRQSDDAGLGDAEV